jgi:hypothetical protein
MNARAVCRAEREVGDEVANLAMHFIVVAVSVADKP